jgi:hypothetical protein
LLGVFSLKTVLINRRFAFPFFFAARRWEERLLCNSYTLHKGRFSQCHY